MNIVYASDDNFAEILGISMISLCENKNKNDVIDFYVLNDKISDLNIKKINGIALKYGCKVTFIDVSGINIPENIVSVRWSRSAFTRIYLKKILPDNIEKCLYLDCDTLVRSSLNELYSTDVNDFVLAGVSDCVSKEYRKNLNLRISDIYINSGVLLINLRQWNTNEMLSFYEHKFAALHYPDQDLINGVYSARIKLLNLKYNCYTALFDFTYKNLMSFRKPPVYYSESDVISAKKNPVIVHFTGSFLSLRPWNDGCLHVFSGEWLYFKSISPWADVPLKKNNRSKIKEFAVVAYNFMPASFAASIAGIFHAFVIPWMKRRKTNSADYLKEG